MSKKCRFRGPCQNEHGKWAKTLFQSGRQHLSHIYWSTWKEFSRKKSLLVICLILGLSTHSPPMTTILFLIGRIYSSIFRCKYLRNKKRFPNYFVDFKNLDLIFNIFKKKDDPHRWFVFEPTHFEKRG